jgi:putative ABC transport system ATP-binding protein
VAGDIIRLDKNYLTNNISGGQQQRVAVARAAMPDLILADEPAGNLDTRSTDRVVEVINGRKAALSQRIELP